MKLVFFFLITVLTVHAFDFDYADPAEPNQGSQTVASTEPPTVTTKDSKTTPTAVNLTASSTTLTPGVN